MAIKTTEAAPLAEEIVRTLQGYSTADKLNILSLAISTIIIAATGPGQTARAIELVETNIRTVTAILERQLHDRPQA